MGNVAPCGANLTPEEKARGKNSNDIDKLLHKRGKLMKDEVKLLLLGTPSLLGYLLFHRRSSQRTKASPQCKGPSRRKILTLPSLQDPVSLERALFSSR